MPSISAVPFTTVPAVRVMINWADTPSATYATVFRIDCETGEEQQLRPYIAYNDNGFERLSCGQSIFWDTEFPFDRCVRYCTRAQTALGAFITASTSPIVTDTFSRVLVDTWGSADTGQAWTNLGGTSATDYDVNGGAGIHTHTAVNSLHTSVLNTGYTNQDISCDFMLGQGSATGAPINQWVVGRFTDLSNYYTAILSLDTAGALSLIIGKRVAGSLIFLGTTQVSPVHTGGEWWTVRLQVWGSQIRAKAWLRTAPQPTGWTHTLTDTSLTTGTQAGVQSRLEVGNTNTLSVFFSFDNFTMSEPCTGLTTAETCSLDLMVSSSGYNMLRDPMRPCNDVRVGLCWPPDPECRPGRGVYFARLEAESYASNSQTQQAFNAARPATASRERSDAASTLILVSRTFVDRDAVLDALKPGTPLLWQTAPEYGQPDRYIQVGDASVTRYHPDHRYQPRTITLPFYTVDRPEGPAQGICGARVKDLCDIYGTWGAMTTAGLSYQDILLGFASPDGPPDTNRRDWIDVETGFANWLGVETAPNTWKTLRDGE